MSPKAFTLRRLDCRTPEGWFVLRDFLRRLSPHGDIVSERGKALTQAVFGEPLTPRHSVERICEAVRERGFAAIQEFSHHFDQYELTRANLRVSAAELAQAHAAANANFLSVVRQARDRIQQFQSAIRNQDVQLPNEAGERIGLRYRPVRRVGVCVPGGAAAYPSTLLMTVVPAQVAGVAEVAVVAPPTAFGSLNRDILAVCHELGVTEVYRLGGAHGVAALAYGCEGLPAVDLIVGPGNLFVALAKKHVFGTVGIDSIAGPSEVVLIADDTARPDFVAADLIAQAEHSPGASLLLTWHEPLLDLVQRELVKQLADLSRGDLTRTSLEQYGALVRVADETAAIALCNEIAPEHLHIQATNARAVADRCVNAGAIFLGPHTPVAVGDYLAGPSHVLPTGATARFASGLSVNTFLRSTAIMEYDAATLASQGAAIEALANLEQLPGHAASVRIRLS